MNKKNARQADKNPDYFGLIQERYIKKILKKT